MVDLSDDEKRIIIAALEATIASLLITGSQRESDVANAEVAQENALEEFVGMTESYGHPQRIIDKLKQ